MEWAVSLLTAVTVSFLCWTILSSAPKRAMASAPPVPQGFSDRALLWFGKALGPAVQARRPDLAERFDRKFELLGTAGGNQTGAEYIAGAIGLAIAMFLVFLAFTLLVGMSLLMGVAMAIGFGGLGFFLALRRLDNQLAARIKALDREFPYFLDFTVMTKQAGAILVDSIRLFVESAGNFTLAREMDDLLANRASGPGGLLGALEEYHRTCPSEVGRTALMALIAAEPVGASTTTTLVALAEDMRHDRRQRAERAAEALRSRIMLPVTLMLVGMLIMLLSGSLAALLFSF